MCDVPVATFQRRPWLLGNLKLLLSAITEIQSLNITPAYQRQGIGSALVKKFLEDLDGEECCVFASDAGRDLYEKFGFKVVQRGDVPLQDYLEGSEPFVNYALKKEGRKAGT